MDVTFMASPIILMVEDERLIATLLTLVLRGADYEVLHAQSGAEALSLGQSDQRKMDLLLCDVVLQDGPGPDVARRMAQFYPGLRTVYISGYPLDVLAERGLLTPEMLRSENAFYIQKPFRPKELLELVGRILPKQLDSATCGTQQAGVSHATAAY
jgi:two-component system, cell cycle sensor histidine kinase and response regulator CckA